MPPNDTIIAAFNSLVQDLSRKGHPCQLVQVLRVINVDNVSAYAHAVGDYSAFIHFDNNNLFQQSQILKDILPTRMSLATRGIAVTAVRHDYEKEAALEGGFVRFQISTLDSLVTRLLFLSSSMRSRNPSSIPPLDLRPIHGPCPLLCAFFAPRAL
ncbi:BQ2448_5122 [Microbotryum intermedium]|uniref:BQ2448_5122 protein n=1 Tax=Microbotryum intermedium TaxID=269621 RepID=A0A238F660_9BASI|nr:BQ2448_5122 [Microbotryum intermedium]